MRRSAASQPLHPRSEPDRAAGLQLAVAYSTAAVSDSLDKVRRRSSLRLESGSHARRTFRPVRIALVSTPVSPIGGGVGGGVELTIGVIGRGLVELGHDVTVVAPQGSAMDGVGVIGCTGSLHTPVQRSTRTDLIQFPGDTVLGSMWRAVLQKQPSFDVVINFAYDWLGWWLGGTVDIPVAHLVSMGSLTDAMDNAIVDALRTRPGSVAMHTLAQCRTYTNISPNDVTILGNGLPIEHYVAHETHDESLAFVGRIAPEKGLLAAADVAHRAGRRLHVYGYNEHPEVLAAASRIVDLTYEGFLSNAELGARLGRHAASVCTPLWDEAFGNVVAEALACGVPVLTWARGGSAELVDNDVTGFVVPADDVDALVAAVAKLDTIDRTTCRTAALGRFSPQAMARRVEAWISAHRDACTAE
jgi:UDP-glucose:tetrahydrobiopterin glucosyltransferase